MDVIDRVVAALNRGDLDGFVAAYAVNATIEDGEGVVLARGHDGIRRRYRQMFADFPNLRVRPRRRWSVGEYVLQDERVSGRLRSEERQIVVYRVVDEQIAREQLFR